MIEYLAIGITAFGASLLTFFSGFGLSTILTPVFILFFPLDIAIGLTAIVHFLNNLFKISLVGKSVNWKIGLKFGAPAILGAFIGATVLTSFETQTPLYVYEIFERTAEVTTIKLIIALIMISFALLELSPKFNALQFDQSKLPIGGLISGFFGGLSGHQGALRSLFLLKCGLSKTGFIATGVAIATFIDITRISVYFSKISFDSFSGHSAILITAILSAFLGAFLGKRVLKKITLDTVQLAVSIMIVVLGLLLGSGII